jgi:Rrf2 family protein
MKLSTRGDYAVRALLELAEAEEGAVVPLSEIADRTSIPLKYLEQIMMRLRTARVVTARRGARGGYAFARRPSEVTVGEVVRAMDGPLAPSLCASRTAHAPCPAYRCPSEDECVMRGLWVEVRDAIADILDRTTFGDLAERARSQREAGRVMYQI